MAALTVLLQRRNRLWSAEEARMAGVVAGGAYRRCGEGEAEMGLILIGDRMMRDLNRRFRGEDKETNVLAFPPAPQPKVPDGKAFLGDVVLSRGRIHKEARAEGLPLSDHLARLTIHGLLHLMGFRHDHDAEARAMESAEREILIGLGYPDPYR